MQAQFLRAPPVAAGKTGPLRKTGAGGRPRRSGRRCDGIGHSRRPLLAIMDGPAAHTVPVKDNVKRLRPAVADDLRPGVMPEDCRQMSEVRAEIDRIDRNLVRLLAERQAYIEAAARIKPHADEVRLEWRIEDVVAKVLAEAEAAGLSARIAEPVWRELVDRCIDHEHEKWRSFHLQNENK